MAFNWASETPFFGTHHVPEDDFGDGVTGAVGVITGADGVLEGANGVVDGADGVVDGAGLVEGVVVGDYKTHTPIFLNLVAEISSCY